LTHPIILAYSLFIAGLYASIVTIIERNYKKFGLSVLLLIIVVLPAVFLRFMEGPLAPKYAINLQLALRVYPDDATRFSYIKGTPFYGFAPQVVKITGLNPENLLEAFFSWSYVWLLVISLLWSLFNLKRNTIAPFVFSASLLVLLCGIPYTGWLVGYFVTAGMLWRSPWAVPIGLITVALFTDLVKFLLQSFTPGIQSKTFHAQIILGLTCILCIVPVVHSSIQKDHPLASTLLAQNYSKKKLERLAALGNYLENNLKKPSLFVAEFELMNYLPGLSSKAKVVYFRTPKYTPRSVDLDKLGILLSPDLSIPLRKRLNILRRYQIQYILVDDPSLKDFYANNAKFFHVQQANNLWIVEFEE